MKTILAKSLALSAILGLTLGTSLLGQDHPSGLRGQRPVGVPSHPGDASKAGAHLAAAYATVAPFDRNADGRLDDAEVEHFVQALQQGTVKAPAHRSPPAGIEPSADRILQRITGVYARTAGYDANHDGHLDAGEQAALQAAIVNGELSFPGPRRSGPSRR